MRCRADGGGGRISQCNDEPEAGSPADGAFLLHERELFGEAPHDQPGFHVGFRQFQIKDLARHVAAVSKVLKAFDVRRRLLSAATAALNQKADRFEWEAFAFVRDLLALLGIDTDAIRFQRQCIANESETVADIAAMRADIDRATALRLNPYIQPEEAEALLRAEGSGLAHE